MYARFDDRWDDHRKIKRALRREPAAVAMHAMAITYCNRHNSDGEIDVDWVEERLALMPYSPPRRQRVLDVLVDLRLFERVDDETFVVHDYLDWNLSREQRARLAEQGRRGGRGRSGSSPTGSGGSSQGLSEGLSGGLSQSGNGGLSTPPPTPTPTPSQVQINAELRSAVIECFAYWQEQCGHPQAQLDDKRRRSLEGRLRDRKRHHHSEDFRQPILDIRQAIDGAAVAPFIDQKGKRFDDIELICRNVAKLEDFMARATDGKVVSMRSGAIERRSVRDLHDADPATRERIERRLAQLDESEAAS